MRKNICLFIAAAIALSGCDDSPHGKATVKSETRKSSPDMASAYRIGAGWRATSDTPVSAWAFNHKADDVPPDSLDAIRTALEANMLPPRDSVRIADLVNRLLPAIGEAEPGLSANAPSGPAIILVTTPWNDDTLLLWVEISGIETSGGAPVSISFNPDAVAAFRPLGDPTALPILKGEGDTQPSAAMLYELMLQPNIAGKTGTRFAVLRREGLSSDKSKAGKTERAITTADMVDNFDDAPEIVRFSAAVAGFGGLLRGDPGVRDLSCGDVISLAQSADRSDPDGRRARVVHLMQRAEPLIELPSGDQSSGEGAR